MLLESVPSEISYQSKPFYGDLKQPKQTKADQCRPRDRAQTRRRKPEVPFANKSSIPFRRGSSSQTAKTMSGSKRIRLLMEKTTTRTMTRTRTRTRTWTRTTTTPFPLHPRRRSTQSDSAVTGSTWAETLRASGRGKTLRPRKSSSNCASASPSRC